jgi:hypothetical protein
MIFLQVVCPVLTIDLRAETLSLTREHSAFGNIRQPAGLTGDLFKRESFMLPGLLTHTPGPTWSVAGHSLGRTTSNRVGRLFEKEIQAVYRGWLSKGS